MSQDSSASSTSDDAVASTPTVAGFLGPRYWPEDELQQAVVADTAQRGRPIEVSPETGKLLSVLVRAAGATRILEIGTLFGYSGIWLARQLPEGGRLDTIEVNDVHADAAAKWFERAGLSDRVTIHRGPGADVLETLPGPYDVVFVDADKESYPRYAAMAIDRLRPGGMLIVDNSVWSGRIADPNDDDPSTTAIRAMHDFLAASDRVIATTIEVGDGLAIAVKLGEE